MADARHSRPTPQLTPEQVQEILKQHTSEFHLNIMGQIDQLTRQLSNAVTVHNAAQADYEYTQMLNLAFEKEILRLKSQLQIATNEIAMYKRETKHLYELLRNNNISIADPQTEYSTTSTASTTSNPQYSPISRSNAHSSSSMSDTRDENRQRGSLPPLPPVTMQQHPPVLPPAAPTSRVSTAPQATVATLVSANPNSFMTIKPRKKNTPAPQTIPQQIPQTPLPPIDFPFSPLLPLPQTPR